jgi:hypothetical protein
MLTGCFSAVIIPCKGTVAPAAEIQDGLVGTGGCTLHNTDVGAMPDVVIITTRCCLNAFMITLKSMMLSL